MSKPLVVVTGASSGIGAATAKAFAQAGYPQLLLARRLEEMEALNLPNAICRNLDVMDVDSFHQAIADAEAEHGKVDCLVNNAGVMHISKTADQPLAEWQQMLDVNLRGLLNGIHLVLNDMVERKTGTIINLGSIAGRKTFGNHAVYCGTKWAVHAMTEAIREEVARSNVRLVTIAPGMVETALVNDQRDTDAEQGWRDYAEEIGGALQPESIAETILFSYEMPQSVCVREIVICPTGQEP